MGLINLVTHIDIQLPTQEKLPRHRRRGRLMRLFDRKGRRSGIGERTGKASEGNRVGAGCRVLREQDSGQCVSRAVHLDSLG